MDDKKLSRLSDDVHLLAAPFRHLYGMVRAAVFLATLTLVILGLCLHSAMVGGPIMDDDLWFLTKVLLCVLAPFAAALVAGMLSKGGRASAWAKEFVVLILSFVAVAGLLRFGVVTFNDGDHAPAIWTNPEYDYEDVYRGGRAFRIGSMENGRFEPSSDEIRHLRSGCLAIRDPSLSASCVKAADCMKHSAAPGGWKARHCH
jgi:hypothetical protein